MCTKTLLNIFLGLVAGVLLAVGFHWCCGHGHPACPCEACECGACECEACPADCPDDCCPKDCCPKE